MSWLWSLPFLLILTLGTVFRPLFSRYGNQALPQGLEDDPWEALIQQRERLLRQLKEWQLEPEKDTESVGLRLDLERELADVLTRMDGLGLRVLPVVSEGEGRGRNPIDMAFGVAAVVVLVAVSGGLYMALGTPMPPLSSETPSPHGAMNGAPSQETILKMVAQLAERMEKEPDNREGWLKLGRSYAVLGNYGEAVRVYTHILARHQDDREAAVRLAELQVQSGVEADIQQGAVSFRAILATDPNQSEALWFLGSLAAREGDRPHALELWQRLLPLLQGEPDSLSIVEQAIQELQSR